MKLSVLFEGKADFIYHSTSANNLNQIKMNGLKPSCEPQTHVWGNDLEDHCMGKIFFARDVSEAIFYGTEVAKHNLSENGFSGFPILLRVNSQKLDMNETPGGELYSDSIVPSASIEIFWQNKYQSLRNFKTKIPELVLIKFNIYVNKELFVTLKRTPEDEPYDFNRLERKIADFYSNA